MLLSPSKDLSMSRSHRWRLPRYRPCQGKCLCGGRERDRRVCPIHRDRLARRRVYISGLRNSYRICPVW